MSDLILDVREDREAALARAVEVLREGRLVVVPTDTVYGVVADAFQPTGTRRIFGAKRRSRRFPLPVFVRNPKQLNGLCPEVPTAAELLMAAYWPGALTLVVPAQPELSWDLGDGGATLQVRMPMDDLVLDLVREVGPLAATGAQLAGRAPATTAQRAHEDLGDLVDAYLDDGERPGTGTSTIVDVTRGEPVVLREGLLPSEDVLAVARGEMDPIEAGNRVLAAAMPVPPAADGDAATDDEPRHDDPGDAGGGDDRGSATDDAGPVDEQEDR